MHRISGTILSIALLAAAVLYALPRNDATPSPAATAWGAYGREKPSTFDKPRCVALAPDGTLYCLDLTGRLQHFTADGQYLDELHMPDVSVGRPQGICVGHNGFVYVADTHYQQVVKFAPSGEIVLRFGKEGTAPGKFFWPCAIAVAADGTIYTGEYGASHDRIQVWNPDGTYRAHWGTFGTEDGQFMRPMGIALDATGNVYVADAVNHRVQVFKPDGTLLRIWGRKGTQPGELYYPYDISIDAEGRLYTVEYGAHRVQRFSATGTFLGAWGTFGPTPGHLSHPWGLDVTPQGTVFVADTYNYRVVRTVIPETPTELAGQPSGKVSP